MRLCCFWWLFAIGLAKSMWAHYPTTPSTWMLLELSLCNWNEWFAQFTEPTNTNSALFDHFHWSNRKCMVNTICVSLTYQYITQCSLPVLLLPPTFLHFFFLLFTFLGDPKYTAGTPLLLSRTVRQEIINQYKLKVRVIVHTWCYEKVTTFYHQYCFN